MLSGLHYNRIVKCIAVDRNSLLARGGVSRQDLLMQIIGVVRFSI